jgi:hypothetical protein
MGLFVALGIEAVALSGLRRAEHPAGARTWMGLFGVVRRIGPVAMLTMLIPGVWMMIQTWGPRPWLETALIAVVAMAVIGGVVSGRVMRRVGMALSNETGPALSPAFRSLRSECALIWSLQIRIAIAIGILALMAMKPGWTGSLLILCAAVLVGVAASIRVSVRRAAEVAREKAARPVAS